MAETWDDPNGENWSTQLADEADISVCTPSTDEMTETEPLSDRASGSAPWRLSALDVTLDSEGAAGGWSSSRALGARE